VRGGESTTDEASVQTIERRQAQQRKSVANGIWVQFRVLMKEVRDLDEKVGVSGGVKRREPVADQRGPHRRPTPRRRRERHDRIVAPPPGGVNWIGVWR
jgi:hypothetical protein